MSAANAPAKDFRTVGERSNRDLGQAASVFSSWLAKRMPEARDVIVSDLAWPQGAGMSNETILMHARWTQDGKTTEQGLVARLAPKVVQFFKDADLRRQFDLLKAVHAGGHVKVAEPLWFEEDASLLGQPFYVMRRLEGRVPVSFPGYNVAGFLFDASPRERAILWRSAMEELCRIATTPIDAVQVLAMPDKGATGFDQLFNFWKESCRWAGADRAPFLMSAEAWLEKHQPQNPMSGFSWGDARIGNMMFGDDFNLTGVMDWEQASLGGPMHDLGWWLYFDDMHSWRNGHKRIEGLGTRKETVDLWRELTGFEPRSLVWHEVFAGYKLAAIVARRYASTRDERPGFNLNNNAYTRAMAELMGIAQPIDAYLHPPT
jgi:aminoglycoside phosphotransferase (APT) family kinase protein